VAVWAATLLAGFEPPAAAGSGSFTFVQVCDPQLGITDYKEDICSLEQAVKQINLLGPEFVLLCGDRVHTPNDVSLSDFGQIVAALAVPTHAVAGNHDVTLAEPNDFLRQYREGGGRDTYSFEKGGFRFVAINTCLLKNPVPGETERMLQRLRAELDGAAKAGDVPILVGHHPPFFREPNEEEQWQGLPPEPRRALLALFEPYHVCAYLSGHTHCFVEHRSGQTQIVSGEATSKNTDGRPLGFRLWHAEAPRALRHVFVPLYKRAQIKPKPPYRPELETGAIGDCVANLRLIDAAKEALGMQRGLTNGAVVAESDVYTAIKGGGVSSPTCPGGGTYRIGALGRDPECSAPEHRLPYFYQFDEFKKRAAMQAPLRDRLLCAAP
jgi:predicted phosphodiesterase